MTTYTKPRVRDAVRHFNKHVLNPAMMTLAGRRYWYASVIKHTGRKSGNHYATPVVAVPIPDGFVVPLPYGSDVDWLRNVRAAGSATIRSKGQTYHVVRPHVVDASTVEPLLPADRRRVFHAFNVDSYAKFALA
ncbi:nitroreductase [Mycobacterium gordonae]|uniref:Nitroreductase n=1 Tax=Mycobacterium gordonae TaxID=1778 RepID=A0A0Q2X5I5_MYCGO|nr:MULTISPECIES: nitroreductase family deazaflavin-dependent oxidoreductase [Mycobacterium]KQH76572.1 nitroreductase [Mycobacterium gordonae]MDP7729049.1 nitroreductase family deazaflavin-dependent oxidoreductase [Mycobacterium sp. TY813]